MSSVDTRQIGRDSLFLMATLRFDGEDQGHRVKVRNLSSGGLMAEGGPKVARGMLLTVDLRNIGVVPGSVAWVQDNRFGIAFAEEIDPKMARATPVASETNSPRYTRPPIPVEEPVAPGSLRNI